MIRAWAVLLACLAVVGEAALSSQIRRHSVSKPLLRLKGGFFGKQNNAAKDDANAKKAGNGTSAVPLVDRTGPRGMRMLRTTSYSSLNEDRMTEPGAKNQLCLRSEYG
jgi:hypothetical protein